MAYTFLVCDALSGGIIDEMPFQNVRYRKGKNVPGSFTATIGSRHPKATEDRLMPVKCIINVMRDDRCVWSGPIWNVNADDLFGETVTITAEGMFSYFLEGRRKVRPPVAGDFVDFSDIDPLLLANSLLLLGQVGVDYDLRIDVDLRANTGGRASVDDYSVQLLDQHSIGDDITSYANAGRNENGVEQGFEFDITGALQGTTFRYFFQLAYPTFSTPWDPVSGTLAVADVDLIDVNSAQVMKYGIRKDGKQMTRVIDAIGADNELVTVVDTATPPGAWPVVESAEKIDLVWDDNLLFALGQKALERHTFPFTEPQLTTLVSDATPIHLLRPGSSVTLTGGIGFTAGSRSVQVEAWEIGVDSEGKDVAVVQFSDLAPSVSIAPPKKIVAPPIIVVPTPPNINSITPSTGTDQGGTIVTIVGANFVNLAAVTFGSVASTYSVNSTTSISATSPAQSAGQVHITVWASAGVSVQGPADLFTYTSTETYFLVTENNDAIVTETGDNLVWQ